MRSFFLLIALQILWVTEAIANIPKKDPIALAVGKDTYITYQDFDQLKIMIAVPVLTWIFKEAVEWWKKKHDHSQQEDREFKKEVIGKLNTISMQIANLETTKANTDDIQEMVRTELEYIERIRK